MSRKIIAVLFGGQSSEHEVSCMSAVNVISQISEKEYEILMIGITKEGRWIKTDSTDQIKEESWVNGSVEAVLSPDASDHGVLLIENGKVEKKRVDVVWPVLHGLYGEDGTIQGLLEMACIPYVGCGVLSSAISMDKAYTKIIVDTLKIDQADYVRVEKAELSDMNEVVGRVEKKLGYPVFVKPSNAGSSKGVSKADNREELKESLLKAAKEDRRILVEETIVGHEVECAVFGSGNEPVQTSGVGEILSAAEFYDYDSKYLNPQSRTVVNPTLPSDSAERVRAAAAAIFSAVDGEGLARADFFVTEQGRVVFNEINTMPGFTAISMYPMLWEKAGITKSELVSRLIESAFCRRA